MIFVRNGKKKSTLQILLKWISLSLLLWLLLLLSLQLFFLYFVFFVKFFVRQTLTHWIHIDGGIKMQTQNAIYKWQIENILSSELLLWKSTQIWCDNAEKENNCERNTYKQTNKIHTRSTNPKGVHVTKSKKNYIEYY